ncbi:MAG: tRNA pseudouridine(55) synthase TruB [Gammaproteobacteria bacterium]|nr:tRNA pseudouridine(55) synthase TruB [Gammaproteobacteria bacterium]
MTSSEPVTRRRRGRDVHGIVLLDKPSGISSNAALQITKRLYHARKAGHCGSLDPLASGLLPLCLGEATKVAGFLLDTDKHYQARCRLGVTTTTGDAEGEVLAVQPVGTYSAAELESVLAGFRGEQQQMPPMHSALKQQGQPLYKLAHKGLSVERAARNIRVNTLHLVQHAGDELTLEVACSKGTYIRTLVEDIGARLGCGAHVTALRRTGAGGYRVEDAITLPTLQALAEQAGPTGLDHLLQPMQSALVGWPQLRLSDDSTYYLQRGQAVFVPQAPTSGWVSLYAADERFLGMGEMLGDGRVAPRRLINYPPANPCRE